VPELFRTLTRLYAEEKTDLASARRQQKDGIMNQPLWIRNTSLSSLSISIDHMLRANLEDAEPTENVFAAAPRTLEMSSKGVGTVVRSAKATSRMKTRRRRLHLA
jgi:hypothetical protein